MKNIRRFYIPLCYAVIVFLFFNISEMLCVYIIRLELRSSYDNTPYRKEAVMFLLSAEGKEFIDLSEVVRDDLLDGCAVLRYDEESYRVNEVIYCDQDVIKIYDSNKINFLSGQRAAWAGVDSGFSADDVVVVDGIAFPVEGVLERHISTAINTGVFYSYCDLSYVSTQEVYVLTAKNWKRIANAYNQLEELVKRKGAKIQSREMSRARFSDYVNYEGVMVFLLGVLSLFYVGLICLSAYIWFRLKTPEILVLKLLGYQHTRMRVWAEYFVICLSAFLLSLLTLWLSTCGL